MKQSYLEKNKKGKNGVINKTGEIGSGSFMYTTDDPEFWKNIEIPNYSYSNLMQRHFLTNNEKRAVSNTLSFLL